MDLSVITVTWNSREFIGPQIESVKRALQNIAAEQLIVDNASTDGTVEYIRDHYPEITLVAKKYNAGFAAANNECLSLAQGENLVFLNADTLLEPGSLEVMLEWMWEHPQVGILGPALGNQQGQLKTQTSPRRFPTLGVLLLQLFKLPHLFPSLLGRYQYADLDFSKDVQVDTVRGSCLMVRRELFTKLGFAFDPRYFIWFEDVDLCREAKRLGFEIWFTPTALVRDYVGQSFKKVNHLARQKQFFKSAVLYFEKWEPGIKPVILKILSPIGLFLVRLYSWFK